MTSVRVFWFISFTFFIFTCVKCRRYPSSHIDERTHFWEDRRTDESTTTETPRRSFDWSQTKLGNRTRLTHRRQYGYTRSNITYYDSEGGRRQYSWNRTDPGDTFIRYSETRYKSTDPVNVTTSTVSRRYYQRFNETTITRDGSTIFNQSHYSNTTYLWQTEDVHPLSHFAVYTHGGSSGASPLGCEESSCYPATGNLLIGREDKLRASSTCGLRGPERYCIVSHLKERKKCFFCDSRPSEKNNLRVYHGIENIVSRIGKKRKAWWQSENGVEKVSIQLDLEAEFHFTHLIITFKTFRPAAMLIERSHDFGQTWKVYQYFAYDCAESFPNVTRGPRQQITDVVCDSHYSGVEPSTDGEVIFRVLLPNLPVPNPYSPAVQELLKMTNLRINFTKLHTLGDNLLDSRFEIKEKYYYAIYDMVVRGSCSCYGHASRCIADGDYPSRPDMVYGKCECTHNTKGLNCEQCEDFYNDAPWKPAIGRQTNACQKCNCNGHAVKCHFDKAVWEATGRQSGGVCDDCQHNTMGRHCEQCKPYFYQDPGRDIRDPNICHPCDCDPRGSLDEGICEPKTDILAGVEAGQCHCKSNVEGWRCDRCKSGYWNFRADNPDGCEACSCNPLGTIGNQGCNVHTGECICKRNVVGRDCNQCLPEFYGLDEKVEGCKPCDCDPGGAYDNNCDVITGQCRCRPHVQGRRCDQTEPGFFAGHLDFLIYEAELAKGSPNTQVVVREPYPDRETTWTGLGFMRTLESSHLEFDISDIPASMDYDIIIRYEPQLPGRWENVRIVLERLSPVDPTGPCATKSAQADVKTVALPSGERYAIVYPPACLEKGKNYRVKLEFLHYNREVDTPSASILIDSIVLLPRTEDIPFFKGTPKNEYHLQEFERFRCGQAYYTVVHPAPPDVCKKYLYSIAFYVFGQAHECSCDPTGSLSTNCDNLGGQCTCKQLVVGRRCERCAPGTFGFGPTGCQPCDCNSIGSLDNFCEATSGQCKCRPNTYGRQCDECQPGFWNYPNCERCDCNGHADICDSRTGFCIDCRDHTAGPKCDRCQAGFYGDPRLGLDIPCRPCSCPGTVESGVNHAHTCELDPRTQNVVCHCETGYAGERCDRCANNYFGEPTVPGGECRRCNCSNNIDETALGNCDSRTGECLRCLYNTDGPHCEYCKPGYYGDASRQQCIKCVCNILGTDQNAGECDRVTGQCPCLPNVIGQLCDRCAPDHWKIALGQGCEACDCDSLGSYGPTCNEFDGKCPCKPGHGGRKCNECQDNFWGDPKIQCQECDCNKEGSATMQCSRTTGACVCLEGIAGQRCDQCARGYTGQAPYCDPCGECFTSWDSIIQDLKEQTKDLLETAERLKQTGTTGAYTREFTEMMDKLEQVREILRGANVTTADIDQLQGLVDLVRRNLTASEERLKAVESELESTADRTLSANFQLNALRAKAHNLTSEAAMLKENATALQLANVEGAYNITKDALLRSRQAEAKVNATATILYESETQRRRTERLLDRARDEYIKAYQQNELALNQTMEKIAELEAQIPDINLLVCGAASTIDYCEPLCGGAGCSHCGAVSCMQGALTRAENALNLSREAEATLHKKEQTAQDLLRNVEDAKKSANEALEEAKLAYERARAAKDRSENFTAEIQELLDRIEDFLQAGGAQPAEIRVLANECLNLTISLKPAQITQLARQINETIESLTNIDVILNETAGDLARAKHLKDRADHAKLKADQTLKTAKSVQDALEEARRAQDHAQVAIEQAQRDITTAQEDLKQIKAETKEAQDAADIASENVKALQSRLNELKKTTTQNELNALKAEKEAAQALEYTDQVEKQAKELEDKYAEVSDSLEAKANVSGKAKDRAERLRIWALQLAEKASFHLNELQEMEKEFDENELKLMDYSKILDRLNREMIGHLEVIDARSTHYRECQA